MKPKEVQQARAFLQKRGFRTSEIHPRDFLAVAHEMGKSFGETLRYIARLMTSQGQGEAPRATRLAEGEQDGK